MHTIAIDPITEKTRELCQTILDDPSFQEIKQNIAAFVADEAAREQHQKVSLQAGQLQKRHASGDVVSEEEIMKFESDRDALFANPVIRGFMDAQREMYRVQESIVQYVEKTYELARIPEIEDLQSEGGCCGGHGGGGCGCSH